MSSSTGIARGRQGTFSGTFQQQRQGFRGEARRNGGGVIRGGVCRLGQSRSPVTARVQSSVGRGPVKGCASSASVDSRLASNEVVGGDGSARYRNRFFTQRTPWNQRQRLVHVHAQSEQGNHFARLSRRSSFGQGLRRLLRVVG